MSSLAPSGAWSILDESYRTDDPDARLDVYFPDPATETKTALPVIWTHGGAWISGSKASVAPYFQLIAAAGYVVVALDYSLGPEHRYPNAIHKINDAHAYVLNNAERFHLDPDMRKLWASALH